jgi:hypothetical protein
MLSRQRPVTSRRGWLTACVALLTILATLVPGAALGHGHEPGPVVLPAGIGRGLTWALTGHCAGSFQVIGTGFCSHGPDDPGPTHTSPGVRLDSVAIPNGSGTTAGVTCDGDGRSGKRIQAIYARTSTTASRYATLLPTLRGYAAGVQSAFLASAAETGGIRRPRWVTGAGCRLVVPEVVLSATAAGNFSQTISELETLGYSRSDRKYLIWFDATTYCGIGTWWSDDRPTQDNISNQTSGYARVDSGCWGWAESHEIMHTLGSVQDSAPHSTFHQNSFGHCSDEYDIMCYVDATGVVMEVDCTDSAHDSLFDCGHDDYFSTAPGPGNYLLDHWNTADSGWLVRTKVALVAPRMRLRAGAQLGPNGVPVTVTYAATAPDSALETVQLAKRQGSASWQAVSGVSAGAMQVPVSVGAGHTQQFRVHVSGDDGLPSPWLDGVAATVTLRQESSSGLTWNGSWTSAAQASASGGRLRWSSRAGATASFSTSAAEVGLVAGVGPDRGRAEVRVDGTLVATLDLYAAAAGARQLVFTRHFTTSGLHKVSLKVLGSHAAASTGNRVDLDAVVLLGR